MLWNPFLPFNSPQADIIARRAFCVGEPQIWWCVCVCPCVCVSVCMSRLMTFSETSFGVSRVVKLTKNVIFPEKFKCFWRSARSSSIIGSSSSIFCENCVMMHHWNSYFVFPSKIACIHRIHTKGTSGHLASRVFSSRTSQTHQKFFWWVYL